MSKTFKTFIVVNPNAQNGEALKKWKKIKQHIFKHIEDYDFELTKEKGSATEIARAAVKKGYEMIVSFGGDGTGNEVLNGFFYNGQMINEEIVLGVLPCGTGSDFRKTLNFSSNPIEALSKFSNKETRKIDIGKLDFVDKFDQRKVRFFLNIVSFGIGGVVDENVNKSTKKFGGKISFFIACAKSILSYKNKKIKLIIDGEDKGEFKILNVVVANGKYFGGGMYVAPDAKIDDGLFDVVVFDDLSKFEFLKLGKSIYKGKHLSHEKLRLYRGKVIEAFSSEEVLLDVDGENPGKIPVRFEVLERKLNIKI